MIKSLLSLLLPILLAGPGPGEKEYKNPVFEPIMADPTVVKADDGWFYAYGTQDDWGDGKG